MGAGGRPPPRGQTAETDLVNATSVDLSESRSVLQRTPEDPRGPQKTPEDPRGSEHPGPYYQKLVAAVVNGFD